MGEPLGIADHAVELVAVQHQKAQPVGGFVDRFAHDLDAGDAAAAIGAQEFVVIAGHVDDARAFVDLASGLRHARALRLAPVPAAFKLPAVDDVADEIERVAGIAREEIGEQLGLAAARAQMGVGDENRAVMAEVARLVGGRKRQPAARFRVRMRAGS